MPKTARAAEPADELAALTYEQAREELVEVVRTLEAGGTTLEQSLALWERGEALAARCQAWLDGARDKLDAALAKDRAGAPADGSVRADDADQANETDED